MLSEIITNKDNIKRDRKRRRIPKKLKDCMPKVEGVVQNRHTPRDISAQFEFTDLEQAQKESLKNNAATPPKTKITFCQQEREESTRSQTRPDTPKEHVRRKRNKGIFKGRHIPARERAQIFMKSMNRIQGAISDTNFIKSQIKHEDGDANLPYIALATSHSYNVFKIGEAITEGNFDRVMKDVKTEINKTATATLKKYRKQERLEVLDKNTRTPVQAPHFHEEGAKFAWYLEKMSECMPWTGGYQTCIDSYGCESYTDKSLLEETAKWQWILEQPVKHKHLPKEHVQPELAYEMAGYEHKMEIISRAQNELELASSTQVNHARECDKYLKKQLLQISRISLERDAVTGDMKPTTSTANRIGINTLLTQGDERKDSTPKIMTQVAAEYAGDYVETWWAAHQRRPTLRYSTMTSSEFAAPGFYKKTAQALTKSQAYMDAVENGRKTGDMSTARYTAKKEAETDFGEELSVPAEKSIQVNPLIIDKAVGKEKLVNMLESIGFASCDMDMPMEYQGHGDFEEDEDIVRQLKTAWREALWRRFLSGDIELSGHYFKEWQSQELISLGESVLKARIEAATKATDARIEGVKQRLYEANCIQMDSCDSYKQTCHRALKQGLSENKPKGKAAWIAMFSWNLVLYVKYPPEFLKKAPLERRWYQKEGLEKATRKAQEQSIIFHAAQMVQQGQWEEIDQDIHKQNRKNAKQNGGIEVHEDHHNDLFIKGFGLSTEEEGLEMRMQKQHTVTRGSFKTASYGDSARVICSSKICNAVFEDNHMLGDLLTKFCPTHHHAFQPTHVPKEMSAAGHIHKCTCDIDNAWSCIKIPKVLRHYFSMKVDGKILYPKYLPHGFKCATKMFRLVTAFLERVTQTILNRIINTPKLESQQDEEDLCLEAASGNIRRLDSLVEEICINGVDEAAVQYLEQELLCTKEDLITDDRTRNKELIMQYTSQIGPAMNSVAPTDLRALEKTTQGFTYVDDFIATGIRPDICKLHMAVYIFVCSKLGIYINAKKVDLEPDELLGLAYAHKVRYHDAVEVEDEDKPWKRLDVDYIERQVMVQPTYNRKLTHYIKQLRKCHKIGHLEFLMQKMQNGYQYIAATSKSARCREKVYHMNNALDALLQVQTGKSTWKNKQMLIAMLEAGEKNPMYYHGITRLKLQGLDSSTKVKVALQRQLLFEGTFLPEQINIEQQQINSLLEMHKEIFDCAAEPVITPVKRATKEVRILIDAARYKQPDANNRYTAKHIQGLGLLALDKQETEYLKEHTERVRSQSDKASDKKKYAKINAQGTYISLFLAARIVVKFVSENVKEYLRLMHTLSEEPLPPKNPDNEITDEYTNSVKIWESGLSQGFTEFLAAALAMIVTPPAYDLVLFTDNQAVARVINRPEEKGHNAASLIMARLKEIRTLYSSSVRAEWIRSELNLADVLTRPVNLLGEEKFERIFMDMLEEYHYPLKCANGDLELMQTEIIMKRHQGVKRSLTELASNHDKWKLFHSDNNWTMQNSYEGGGMKVDQTQQGHITVKHEKLLLEVDVRMVPIASWCAYRQDLTRHLQTSTVDEVISAINYEHILTEANGISKCADQQLATLYDIADTILDTNDELENKQRLVRIKIETWKQLQKRSEDQLDKCKKIVENEELTALETLEELRKERVTIQNRQAMSKKHGGSEFVNRYERWGEAYKANEEQLDKIAARTIEILQEITSASVYRPSENLRKARMATMGQWTILTGLCVLDIFQRSYYIIDRSFGDLKPQWVLKIEQTHNVSFENIQVIIPAIGLFREQFLLHGRGGQRTYLDQLSQVYSRVQKITKLGKEDERIQLRLLTDIALASSVKYASSNAYVDERIGSYGTRDVLLSMEISQPFSIISQNIVTKENFDALVVGHMFTMFGIKLNAFEHSLDKVKESVKEVATAVSNCDTEANEYKFAEEITVDQIFILFYPECLGQNEQAWRAKGQDQLNEVAKAHARWLYSKACECTNDQKLSKTIEYSTIHTPEALAKFAMQVREKEVDKMREKVFKCPLIADMKKRQEEGCLRINLCTQTAVQHHLADLMSQVASEHSQRLLQAIHDRQSQLQLNFEPHQGMEQYFFTQRHEEKITSMNGKILWLQQMNQKAKEWRLPNSQHALLNKLSYNQETVIATQQVVDEVEYLEKEAENNI